MTSPLPAPVPVAGAYGVLFAPSQDGVTYTATIVGTDGKVAASAKVTVPSAPSCSNGAQIGQLSVPVSASNSRLYYMDASGALRFMAPNGQVSASPFATLPMGPTERSMFAVSPDDSLMAVVVANFGPTGASMTLTIDQLKPGGTATQIYHQSGGTMLWPVGWIGDSSLVVAKVAACTLGCGPTTCGPQEYHVVDPATAKRKYTIGGPGCIPSGAPTLAGVACEDPSYVQVQMVNWTAGVFNHYPITGPTPAYVSPDGFALALVRNGQTDILVATSVPYEACGWIDSTHLLSGGTQARVGDFTKGTVVPVAAQGQCAGRIPGGL